MLTGLRSRKHIAPFDFVQPGSIEECCACLAQPARTAIMAGGLDLIDRMKNGEAFDRIVSLSAVPGLSDIRLAGDIVVIGAFATHVALSQSEIVTAAIPDLATLWRQIANPRVRYTGTIGGNLMSALPHYDAMPAFLALGATATLSDAANGPYTVALKDICQSKALLVDVRVPASSLRLLSDRSLHPALSVYLGAKIVTDELAELRVAIGGAYPRACVVELPTEGLSVAGVGSAAASLARTTVESLPEPMADGLASASYRRRMIEVLTRRLLIRLGTRS